jgi:ABC-type sugar transport system ATPase subunit
VRIVAEDLSRSFGNTRALSDVSIALDRGKIHALVGENGAGKSTLLKILAGAERPDSGRMILDGQSYAPRSVTEATRRGVGLVFQEITINPSLTVAENIFAGRLASFRRYGLLTRGRLNRAAQALLDSFSAEISVSQPLSALDLGQWKCIDVARALSASPRAILFDESTAFLNHREVDIVLEAMQALKRQGLVVAFVSHHLAEVGAVADGLTILKDGRKVGDYAADELSRDQIQSLMVGRDLSKGLFPPHATRTSSDNLMRFEDIADERLKPSSLTLGGGEIVGIAGLKGAGGQRILEIAAGVAPHHSGEMKLSGASFRPRIPAEAWAKGIAYLPGDRTGEGLIVGASVLDNLVMARPPRRGPLFDHARAKKLSAALIRRLSIKTKAPQTRAGALSGGNLQKVVLGKCLAVDPRVLLLNNPTRGVDVGARAEIYRSLREAADRGLGILLASEDLNELIGLSDRILVMRAGRIVARIEDPASASEDAIIRHMT